MGQPIDCPHCDTTFIDGKRKTAGERLAKHVVNKPDHPGEDYQEVKAQVDGWVVRGSDAGSDGSPEEPTDTPEEPGENPLFSNPGGSEPDPEPTECDKCGTSVTPAHPKAEGLVERESDGKQAYAEMDGGEPVCELCDRVYINGEWWDSDPDGGR